MGQKVTISPVTRLEGHGVIEIFLDDDGNVADAYLQVVELRGFERFCVGRPVEELPRILPKICGVCPGAHHIAAAKATDAVWGVRIPPAARALRELFLAAHVAHSHLLHFFALAAPDLVLPADTPPERRNLLGLPAVLGKELVLEALAVRGLAQRIQGIIAGHPIHPVAAVPGGMAFPLDEARRDEIAAAAVRLLAFSTRALDLLEERVATDPDLAALLVGEAYRLSTHCAGLVDEQGNLAFYDGRVRVVDPDGAEVARFDPADYLDHLAERVVPWSYLKVPYLKAKGWQGITEGSDSGVYRVNALARLNVADAISTPLAEAARQRLFAFFGGRPVHQTLAFHWARLVELVHLAEEVQRLAADPVITDREVRVVPSGRPTAGVGAVEAARGTLYHHVETDPDGILTRVNLIVATGQNNAAMNLAVRKAATSLIRGGRVDPTLLNRVEMAFRAFDPCLACATHALPGKAPLEVKVHHSDGAVLTLSRPCER